MTDGNKWELLETNSEISGIYNWFQNKKSDAYGFLVLCGLIDIGLILMIVMAIRKSIQKGLPPIGALLAIFLCIVLPVLFINYYGLSYFVNNTTFSLTKKKLILKNSPIPLMTGFDEIDTSEITQIFIQEKKVAETTQIISCFEVKAKIRRKGIKTLFPYSMRLHEEEARELEQKIEDFLGLEDEYVHEEYTAPTPKDLPKSVQKAKRTNLENFPLYDANTKDVFEHDCTQLHLAHITQYDWKSGNSDKQIQALDAVDEERLFYLKRNKGLLDYYVETKIPLAETDTISADFSKDAKTVFFNGTEYQLDELLEGNAFHDGNKGATEVRQIWYLSKDKKEAIRVLLNDTIPTYYHAIKTHKYTFQNQPAERLDLKEIRKEIRMNFLDDDFV